MTVSKMSISLDAQLAADIRAEAAREGKSVSAWIADTVGRSLRRAGLRAFLDDYEAEHGAFTEEERAEARRSLQLDGADPR